MRAQYKQFRLTRTDLGKDLLPVWHAGLTFADEPAAYDFRQNRTDTFLTMRFRGHELTARLVSMETGSEIPLPDLNDALKKEIGSQMTIYFAEHLRNTNRPPQTFEYA
jgi:hypothetical protein